MSGLRPHCGFSSNPLEAPAAKKAPQCLSTPAASFALPRGVSNQVGSQVGRVMATSLAAMRLQPWQQHHHQDVMVEMACGVVKVRAFGGFHHPRSVPLSEFPPTRGFRVPSGIGVYAFIRFSRPCLFLNSAQHEGFVIL